MEPEIIVVIVLQSVVIALLTALMLGIRALVRRLAPMLAAAQQLLGGQGGGIAGLLGAVKGTKPMDLLAMGAVTILPSIAPQLAGAIGGFLSRAGGGPGAAAVPPTIPAQVVPAVPPKV